MENDAEVYDDEDESVLGEDDEGAEANVVNDGEFVDGPRAVEFEPFPQDVADELHALREEEADMARTYDYVPTSVDEHGHALDQFGIRIQRTTRPP